jgi:C4-dicarboxylate transporter, DctQ subunit
LARYLDRLVDAFAWVAAMLIIAIMIGVGIDVGSRSLFGRPVGWMFEFVQYSLLAILFLGSPWLTRQNGHVSIDILVIGLPGRWRMALQAFAFAMSGLTAAFIAYWSTVTAIDNFGRGVLTTGIYPIPRGLLLVIIAVGMALTAIEFFRLLYDLGTGRAQSPKRNEIAPSV